MNDEMKSPSSLERGDEDSLESNKQSKRKFMSFNLEQDSIEMMDDEDDDSDSDDEKFEEVTSVQFIQNNDNLTTTNLNLKINNETQKTDDKLNNLNRDGLVHEEEEEEELNEESEERKRFQIELEFVQSLANPNYLNYLAQRGYFKNQTFLNYLKYLMYWKEPEYCKYIVYPQCLSLLEMLQHEQFLKQIVNAQCAKYIDEQLLLLWLHYKKKHDWIRIDPTKIPDNIEKLFKNDSDSQIKQDSNNNNIENDPFSAAKFIENEKF